MSSPALTMRITRSRRAVLIPSTSVSSSLALSTPACPANAARPRTSFGRQAPPYPMPTQEIPADARVHAERSGTMASPRTAVMGLS
jgi:hypothetical protein